MEQESLFQKLPNELLLVILGHALVDYFNAFHRVDAHEHRGLLRFTRIPFEEAYGMFAGPSWLPSRDPLISKNAAIDGCVKASYIFRGAGEREKLGFRQVKIYLKHWQQRFARMPLWQFQEYRLLLPRVTSQPTRRSTGIQSSLTTRSTHPLVSSEQQKIAQSASRHPYWWVTKQWKRELQECIATHDFPPIPCLAASIDRQLQQASKGGPYVFVCDARGPRGFHGLPELGEYAIAHLHWTNVYQTSMY